MNWKDLTLQQYIDLMNIIKDDSLTDIERTVEIVKCVYNKTDNEINAMTVNEFNALSIDFLKEPIGDLPYPVYVAFDNKEYYVTQLLNELTFGQFIDLQVATSKFDTNNIHLSIKDVVKCFLCDKQTKQYVVGVDVSNMRFVDAYAVLLFFYKFNNKLQTTIQRFLIQTEKKIYKELRNYLK